MACLYPIEIQPKTDVGTAKEGRVVYADCGKCPPCRASKARQWSRRMTDELKSHPYSSYVTLTYAPKCLPSGGNLCHRDIQLFFKRLRIAVQRDEKIPVKKISFFMCGEYGSSFSRRPHYHMIIFGLDSGEDPQSLGRWQLYPFEDYRSFHYRTDVVHKQWIRTTQLLEKAWGKGFVKLRSVGFDGSAVAGYITKYLQKKADYPEGRVPPYHCQSTRPAIGFDWAGKNIDKLLGDGTYTVYAAKPLLAPADWKPYLIPVAYPKAYFRKFLTDEQKQKRALDLVDKAIAKYIKPSEFKKLRTINQVQALIVKRKIDEQIRKKNISEAKCRLFGEQNRRLGVDEGELVFGLPRDVAGLDSPSQVLPKTEKYDSVTGEIKMSPREFEAIGEKIYKLRQNEKIHKAYEDLALMGKIKGIVVDGKICDCRRQNGT